MILISIKNSLVCIYMNINFHDTCWLVLVRAGDYFRVVPARESC